MKNHSFSSSITQMLEDFMETSDEIDYIVFADKHSVRIYHPNSSEIGKSFAGGDEDQILKDSTPYITTKKGEHDVQRRSFHQIQDEGEMSWALLWLAPPFYRKGGPRANPSEIPAGIYMSLPYRYGICHLYFQAY